MERGCTRAAVMARDDRPVPIQRPNGMTVSATACLRWPRTPIAPIRSTAAGYPSGVLPPHLWVVLMRRRDDRRLVSRSGLFLVQSNSYGDRYWAPPPKQPHALHSHTTEP